MSVLELMWTKLLSFKRRKELSRLTKKFAYFSDSARFFRPNVCTCPSKMYMYEKSMILSGGCFIIPAEGESGKFIFGAGSVASHNLTVITGKHQREIGVLFGDFENNPKPDVLSDVTVEEDVWLGANVTLLPGVVIGRGSTIGAGAICSRSVPPYSTVAGVPAKVIGYQFSILEIEEHEKKLYPPHERMDLQKIEQSIFDFNNKKGECLD